MVEWTVFGLGTLLTVAVAVFLLIEAFQNPSEVQLETFTGSPVPAGVAMHVPAGVRNTGGVAAVDVELEVCAGAGACRTLRFPEVPSAGTREGIAVFARGAGPFTARIASYRPEG